MTFDSMHTDRPANETAEQGAISFDNVHDRNKNGGYRPPPSPEQNQRQGQRQGQEQGQEQSTNVDVDNNNKNNNRNSNRNENNNNNNVSSESSSSSSSSSSSRSSADSHSSSSVGPIDNTSGATGGSVEINESYSSDFKYYNPSSVYLAPLPPGGDCTEGSSWGLGSVFGGFSKGKSKINEECQALQEERFQQSLELQERSLNMNIELQKEAMETNMEQQAQQAQAQAEARDEQLDFDKVKAVCDASVDQAEQARETFNTMDNLETTGAQATVGALAHQEALMSLKLGNMCATAFSQELGIEETAPELPPLELPEK